MKILRIKDFSNESDFIGSREAGETIRLQMENIIKSELDNIWVTLDFVGINSVTQSFADEVIGIFIRSVGIDAIKNKIKLVNANDDIRSTFNFVVSYSKKVSA